MSEATRAIALTEAVKAHTRPGYDYHEEDLIETAGKFNAFLTADTVGKVGAAAPGKQVNLTADKPSLKPGATKQTAKPAKTEDDLVNEGKELQRQREAAKEAELDKALESPTKEQVGEAINSLLAANLRKEAVALLGKYGAKSVSGVPVESYAELIEAAEGLLIAD